MFRSPYRSAERTQAGVLPDRVRVVGCGNPYAGDDSVGLEIIRRLRAGGECSCELLAMPQGGVELLQSFQGSDVVLFVDAVSSDAEPGTMYLLPIPSPELEARALGSVSTHGWGLTEVLGLMSALGRPAPRLMLLGIEVGILAPGAPRSEAVERAVKMVVERFSQLLAIVAGTSGDDRHLTRRFPPGDESFPGGW